MMVLFISPAEPQQFGLTEKILFIVLALLSVGLFWRRLRVVLRRVLAAKKDSDFHLAPIAPRLRKVIGQVLFQTKVIRQRPLPGLAHALVFWAFCTFALVTLNHCALAFGSGFLNPESPFGSMYFYFALAFAIACAVAIAGLSYRRFVLHPKVLGPFSPSSGVIAGLIFLLMVTYIAGFFVAPSGPTVRALWWIHTLALLSFLPIIPYTKHLHLLLSPFTVFLTRDGFSKIPPLSGDEDFGLVTGRDLTRIASLQAYSCVECGRCNEHCPAQITGKHLVPKRIILGVRRYLNNFGPASEQPLAGGFIKQETIFQCTTCGACEFQCPVGIQHLPIIIGLRRGFVNTGVWQDEYGSKLFRTLEHGSNALGISPAERDKFIEKNSLPIYDGTQEYCFWLGCMGAYDPQGREIVLAMVRVMNHLGVTFGVLRKERCTGDAVRRLGNDLLFQQLAEANLETLAQAKVKKLISICPHCVRTIQEDWKEYGTPPPIEHHSEFLARYIHRLPRQSGGERIVFHDPCYLGRYRGIYDEPRAVAALAGKVVDPPRSHARSFCCGAGGGLVFLGEESGERISHVRARELTETGAQIIGAACPFCNTMFHDALTAQGKGAPELLDIAQLVARGLPQNGAR